MPESRSEQSLIKSLKIKNEFGFNLGSKQRLTKIPSLQNFATPKKSPHACTPLKGCKVMIKLARRGEQSSEIKKLLIKKI